MLCLREDYLHLLLCHALLGHLADINVLISVNQKDDERIPPSELIEREAKPSLTIEERGQISSHT